MNKDYTYRIPNSKLRSRNGFTQNSANVWGHCEYPEMWGGKEHDCTNRTLFQCDICKQFICASHQKQHMKHDHNEKGK